MPYGIRKKGKKYETYNKDTGRVHGTFDTKPEAVAQFRLLQGVEHGWKPTGKKT